MTDSEIRLLLKEYTNMTNHDIDKHIKDGVLVYENFEEYRAECEEALMDDEMIEKCWNELDIMGNYRVDFVL